MAPVSVSAKQPAAVPFSSSAAATTSSSAPTSSSHAHALTHASNTHKNGSSRRIEISSIVEPFSKRLGSRWNEYQITVSLFLVGKLSRGELMEKLDVILKNDKAARRMHNQLLLANLANSLRDEPNLHGLNDQYQLSQGQGYGSGSGMNKKRKYNSGKSGQFEFLQKNILALSIRERKRLKMITKESGKNKVMMTNSVITLTRQATVPHIPIIANPELHRQNLKMKLDETVYNNTPQWGQDVMHGIQVPLCSESYELPDQENLRARILGIQREMGLLGDVNEKAVEFMTLGLETFLKNIIGNAIDVVKARRSRNDYSLMDSEDGDTSFELNDSLSGGGDHKKNKQKNMNQKKTKGITMTIEDLSDTLAQQPHLVQYSGTQYYMNMEWLKNDDEMVGNSCSTNATNHTEPNEKRSSIYYLLKEEANPENKQRNASNSNVNSSGSNSTSATNAQNGTNNANSTTNNNNNNNNNNNANTSNANMATANAGTNPSGNINTSNSSGASHSEAVGTADELNWIINDLLINN